MINAWRIVEITPVRNDIVGFIQDMLVIKSKYPSLIVTTDCPHDYTSEINCISIGTNNIEYTGTFMYK